MPNVWQVASGDSGRNYSWLFIEHDIMFVGPGRYGPYEEQSYRDVVTSGEYSGQKIGSIASFCNEVQPGDLVLLRRGLRVIAIGIVNDDAYCHDPTLDDVYGWDLQHTRRVIWQEQLAAQLATIQQDGDLFNSRKQIPMFTRVKDEAILNRVRPLLGQCALCAIRAKPIAVPAPLTLEELGQALFSKGLSNDAVDQVKRAIERQRRLLLWYSQQPDEAARPDEHEVVAHMVLPLLLALGWSEQLLAVEWHKVDLAAFWGTPTTSERCVLVCEAKRMGHGLQDVWGQAIGYVENLALTGCTKILLTQGARFYLYNKLGDEWPIEPTGYINLQRIRTNHVAPANTNAVDTLMALTPAGVSRK